MSKRMLTPTISELALLTFTIWGLQSAHSQTTPPHAPDGWDRPVASVSKAQPGPAPRPPRAIAGIIQTLAAGRVFGTCAGKGQPGSREIS